MRDQHFFASIDKAQELLGWTPQFDLVGGLKVAARHAGRGRRTLGRPGPGRVRLVPHAGRLRSRRVALGVWRRALRSFTGLHWPRQPVLLRTKNATLPPPRPSSTLPSPPLPQDSYDKDFGLGQFRKAADFECDDMILAKAGKKTVVMA